MGKGFGKTDRKVRRLKGIVYTTLCVLLLLIVVSIFSILEAVKESEVHKPLIEVIKEVNKTSTEEKQ